MAKGVPTVNLSKFISGDAQLKKEFIQELGDAFSKVGFVAVENHSIDLSLIDGFYDRSKEFFALDTTTKASYIIEDLAGQRGYTSFGVEHAKHSKVGDLKEFFQLGQTVPMDHPLDDVYPRNIVTREVPEFYEYGQELYQAFEKTGAYLLQAIALYLGLDENYFDQKIHYGNSILRSIHYPPIIEEPASAIRSERHEDINLITLLVGASAGGLQVLTKEQEWKDAVPEKNEIMVNVGDMLQRLTNNQLVSTTHRVVNPPKEQWHTSRLSIPFFLHPKGQVDLTVLDICVENGKAPEYDPITADEYLTERLKEIGLI